VRALATYRRLLANRPLARLLGGEFVSAIGDWLYIVALLVVIYQKTGDPLILGVFGAARTLPYILLSIPAGVAADRFDRRMILLITDVARGACMLGMAWLVATDGPIEGLIALSILAACFSTFFYPAIGAYIPNLVTDERQLGPANSAWASLDNLGFVVGPALGGVLLATGGVTLAFLINAATFAVIAIVLWGLPPSRNVRRPDPSATAPEPGAGDPRPGEVDEAGEPPPASARGRVASLIGIGALRTVDYAIYGGVGMLTVILATDILQAGEAATGYLNAAIGIGGVTGAVVSGLLVLRRSLKGPLILGGLVLAGGAAALGAAEVLVAAMVAIVAISAGHLLLEVIGATLLQRVTTDAVRGRAVGTMMTLDSTAEAIGALLFPVLVTSFGLSLVMGISAALLVGVTLLGAALIGPALVRPESAFEGTLARVARLPLFSGVPSTNLELALGRLQPVAVRAGDVVIRQGDPADRFYIIETGTFSVSQATPSGDISQIRRLGPDAVFGELGLLSGAPRSAMVTAVTDGVLLALDGPDFLALVGGATSIRGRLLDLYEPAAPALP
jgi:MFS family permease